MAAPIAPDPARAQLALEIPRPRGGRSRAIAAAAFLGSPVAQARRALKGAQTQASLLQQLESDLVAGKGKLLRRALKRLPGALVRHEPREAPAERSAEGPHRAETPHPHPTPKVALSVPLPNGGEAELRVERDGVERDLVRVDVDLELAELGSVAVHLLADEGSVRCRLESADPEVRAFLDEGLRALQDALAAAAGRPAAIALDRGDPGVDAYA
jgi:hypothetical protein